MINDFTGNFNIQFNNNIQYSEIYRNAMASLDLSSCSCPWCNACGRFKRETTYSRYFINSLNEIDHPDTLEIEVFECESCGHCHAILPAFICPFSSYSYPFITESLYEYFYGENKGNLSHVASMMGIPRQTLSRWLRKFEDGHMEIRMTALRKQHKTIDVKQILSRIRGKRELFLFLADFLRLHLHMFLTSQNWFGTRFRYGSLMPQSNKACIS